MNETHKSNAIASTASYLLVAAVAVRGVTEYPDVRNQLFLLLALLCLTIAGERLLPATRIRWRMAFVVSQVAIMIGLYLITPLGDYWAIVLLPACIIVMQMHRERIGWTYIGGFVISMSVMLAMGEGVADSLGYIIVYIAAYVFVGSYSLLLRRTQVEKEKSDRLLVRLREAHRQLGDWASRVEELTSVRERNRIARDLHDSATQTIFSMTLLARSTRMLIEQAPDKLPDQLERIENLAQTALGEMRSLIHELRPQDSDSGLVSLLSRYVNDLRQSDQFDVDYECIGSIPAFSEQDEQQIFSIVREALNNVVKHSKAIKVSVVIRSNIEETSIKVTDDGTGFDLNRQVREPGHMGLESMRERTTEIGGKLNIRSATGNGTTVELTIPYRGEKTDE